MVKPAIAPTRATMERTISLPNISRIETAMATALFRVTAESISANEA